MTVSNSYRFKIYRYGDFKDPGSSVTYKAPKKYLYFVLNVASLGYNDSNYDPDGETLVRYVQINWGGGTTPQTYTVTPSAGSNGSISPNTPQTVSSGGSVTFQAYPNSGYVVDKWYLDGTAVQTGGASYTVSNVTANHTVKVTFKTNPTYQDPIVTPIAGPNGYISPNTPVLVSYGGSVTFEAFPDPGYAVDKWYLDGSLVQSGGASYTLSNVTSNHTVSVIFKVATYTVTPSAGSNGSISPSTTQTVNSGGSVSFQAYPNSGYLVDKWYLDGILVQESGASFTVSDITANHTVNVTFRNRSPFENPGIMVTGNDAVIIDGDTTPSTADFTDFGSALVTGGAVIRTYYIWNTGTSTLTIGNVTVSGTNASNFTVSTQPVALVEPGWSTFFSVTFDPNASGTRNAALSFSTNVANKTPFNFNIQGYGATASSPEIAVSANGINILDGDTTPSTADGRDFGSVLVAGGAAGLTFTVQNTGTSTLTLGTVTVSGTNASDFTALPGTTSWLAPGESTTFYVEFDPSATGTRTASISFTTNDSDENPFNFSLQGRGATALPNLTYCIPPGWEGGLVLSTVSGTSTDAGSFTQNDTIYVDFAPLNNGTAAIPSGWTAQIFVDDVLVFTDAGFTAGLQPNTYYHTVLDKPIGPLTPGTHTIRVTLDTGNAVAETDETDNSYTRTVTVAANQSVRNRDLNADGNADLFFQNNAGRITSWLMDGAGARSGSINVSTLNLGDWKVRAVADLNGDGNPDLVFQNSLGHICLWYLNSAGVLGTSAKIWTEGLGDWRIVGVSDVNHDGVPDLVFQNNAGLVVAWYLNAAGARIGTLTINSGGLGDWRVMAVGDMNNDGNPDLLFQNTSGNITVWYLNAGGLLSSSAKIWTSGLSDWRIAVAADMNNDGNVDLVFQNNLGQISVWYMNGAGSRTSSAWIHTGSLGDWRLR